MGALFAVVASEVKQRASQPARSTAEIARNVTETASAVNEMSSLNNEVSHEAEQAGRYADTVLENSGALQAAVAERQRAIIRTVRTAAPWLLGSPISHWAVCM